MSVSASCWRDARRGSCGETDLALAVMVPRPAARRGGPFIIVVLPAPCADDRFDRPLPLDRDFLLRLAARAPFDK